MLPQLRDSSYLDNTSITGTDFLVPLPQSAPGDPNADPPVPPTLSVINGDWGVALLVWSATSGTPYATLTPDVGWNVLLPPTTANKICFAVLAKQYQSADPVAFAVELSGSRYLLAAATWWSGVNRVDAIGVPWISSSAVSNLATAPSMTASGIQDELVLSAFVSAVNQTGAMQVDTTLPDNAGLWQWMGHPGTVMTALASSPGPGLGPTGDMLAHFTQGSQSHAGVQLGLLATGGGIGGVPAFGPTVELNTTVLPTLTDTPAFNPSVDLEIPSYLLGSLAYLGPTVTLGTRARSLNRIALSTSVQLAVTGKRVGKATFNPRVTLAATGIKKIAAPAAFTPHVTLTARGAQHLAGQTQFGLGVQLTATGRMIQHGTARFGTSVQLSTTGSPTIPGRARFGPTVRLSSARPLVSTSGSVAKSFSLTLRAYPRLAVVSGRANFEPQVSLAVEGIPNFTPVAVAQFAPSVTLVADGFKRPAEPVGVTLKRIRVEPDPVWHEPGEEYDWTVQAPLGNIGFDPTVTLNATGAQVQPTVLTIMSITPNSYDWYQGQPTTFVVQLGGPIPTTAWWVLDMVEVDPPDPAYANQRYGLTSSTDDGQLYSTITFSESPFSGRTATYRLILEYWDMDTSPHSDQTLVSDVTVRTFDARPVAPGMGPGTVPFPGAPDYPYRNPDTFAELVQYSAAIPATPWTTGQNVYLVLEPGATGSPAQRAYWNGTAWTHGVAP